MGVQDPSVAPSLPQGGLLSTKPVVWVDKLQLTRTVSQKQNYRSQKARLVPLEPFPELWTLMNEVFVFILAGVTV